MENLPKYRTFADVPTKKKTGNEEVKLTTERTDLRGASFCYFREHFQNYY
jgi:hypothetical protein